MATTTIKHSNIKRHVLDVSALMAGFSCRFPSAYLVDALTPFVRYPLQNAKKLIEGKIADLPSPKFLHCCNVQRLEIQGVEPITQRMSQLEEPISSTVGNSFVCLAQSMFSLSAIVAAFLLCCQFFVPFGDFRHARLKELRTFNGSAVTESEELFETKICASRVNGTCNATRNLFLLTTKHHPKTIHVVSLERASLNLAFDLASLDELVLVLPKADSVVAKVGPTSLLEDNTAVSSGTLELGLSSLRSSPLLDPLEERLVRQVKFFNNSLDALRTNDLPVFSTIAKFGDVLHQRKLVAMLPEQPIVCLLKSSCMVPNTSSHSHEAVKPVILAAFEHSEFVAKFHLGVTLVFNVLLDYGKRGTTNSCDKIAVRPKRRYATFEVPKFSPKQSTTAALNLLNKSMNPVLGITLDKKMHMVWHSLKFNYLTETFAANLMNNLPEPNIHRINDYISPVLWAPNHMVLARVADVVIGFVSHRLNYTARSCMVNAYFKNIRSVGLYPHA